MHAARAPKTGGFDVSAYGAVGDGKHDDEAAFTAAMDAAAAKGGIVHVPSGTYLISGHLSIPQDVTLEGVWRTPTTWSEKHGSILLAVEGAGSETGPAFLTLHTNSTVKGITVFYPNQKADRIQPYPYCVQGAAGDDESVVDCLLVNPYSGVDFGTNPCGRHYIRGLYGQPLRRGIYVDQCYDIGRIEDVHFWPFWTWDEKSGIREWLWKNGESFVFGRTDWEYVFNTFSFGYRVGYRFIKTKTGAMNGNLVGIGADATNVAVEVDETQPYGLLITNGEFVSFAGEKPTEVVVQKGHTGAVSFSNCSFWGPSYQIGRMDGDGSVTFANCIFRDYDAKGAGTPTLTLLGGRLVVTGCQFTRPGTEARLQGGSAAIFSSNVFAGPEKIENPGNVPLQSGLNLAGKG